MSLPAPDRRRSLARLLVSRPVTMLMLFLTLIGTGLMAYMKIPLTLLPRGLSSSSLTVSLPFPGAAPSEVEDQLTRPVEDSLRTIPGITEVISVSMENAASITVEFSTTTDMDVAYGEVRDRVERIRPQLPAEMDRYSIRRWNSNTDMPVMWCGIQVDADSDDPYGPLERVVVPRLEGVDGVARVGMSGIVDEAVRIFVDVDKVMGYGVDLGDVIRRMQSDNFTLPAGQVDDAGRTLALRVDARFADIEDIRSYPIGNGLVLSDIAEIERSRGYRDWVWRINGQDAVGMDISRESDQNTIEVCTRLEQVIAQLGEDPRLEGITFNIFWSQKEEILGAIQGLQSSALWGGMFAVIILFFFLRDLRLTLLAALAIPSSLLAALMALYFGGQTLNLISLAGFTLGIGMLVDNAVVVIENISRKRAAGHGSLDSAALGAGEVGLAVLTATLTSIVVFLPLVFMEGSRNTRIMMGEVGLPISYSLMASLVVALIFLPTFTARLMGRKAGKTPEKHAADGPGQLVRAYTRAVTWALHHRFGSVVILLLVVAIAQTAAANLRRANPGDEGMGRVNVVVETPSTYGLPDTNGVFENLESWAAEHQEEYGIDAFSVNFERRGGRLTMYARDELSQEQVDQLPDLVRESLPELPGVKTTVGREMSGNTKELRINLNGPDFAVLAGLAEQLKDQLSLLQTTRDGVTIPLLENINTDLEQGLDEVHVRVDRERASELGVSPELIRGMVAWGLGGQRLPDLQDGDREIRVQIEYGQTDEESLLFLRTLGLGTNTGALVPLASVADLEFGKAVGSLVRRNGRTSTGVSATPTVDNLYLVSRMVADVVQQFPFPEGYSWDEEGGQEEFEADFSELQRTLWFSVLLVYLLMAILLESAVLPLSILISIPLALMGVNLTLFATNRPMDAMVVVGMILLAGIVVNNAIVLLDHVQRLRAGGQARTRALIQGGQDRLRPILMTALTTIFGLMPMAVPIWFGGDKESGYEGMAITVAGGLAFSTFFTLLAVPVFYSFFDDIGRTLASFSPWRRRQAGASMPGASALPADEELAGAGDTAAAGVPLAPRDS